MSRQKIQKGDIKYNRLGEEYIIGEYNRENKGYNIIFTKTGYSTLVKTSVIKTGQIRDYIAHPTTIPNGTIYTTINGLEYTIVDYLGDYKYKIKFIKSGYMTDISLRSITSGRIRDYYDNPLKRDTIEVGKEYISTTGSKFIVLKNIYPKYIVLFTETGNIDIFDRSPVRRLEIKDKWAPSVYGIGIVGIKNPKKYHKQEYLVWRSMIRRCYYQDDWAYQYYGAKGVSVCKRWLVFKYFLEDLPNIPGYNHFLFQIGRLNLDKDLLQLELSYNNMIYSPETCMFLCPEINSKIAAGTYPLQNNMEIPAICVNTENYQPRIDEYFNKYGYSNIIPNNTIYPAVIYDLNKMIVPATIYNKDNMIIPATIIKK